VEEHLTVGRLAELAGVTVRTLHHYDEIGLVCPSARTAAGYRAYPAGDVERRREVLAYRPRLVVVLAGLVSELARPGRVQRVRTGAGRLVSLATSRPTVADQYQPE
jgi:MerR family regulatory protein